LLGANVERSHPTLPETFGFNAVALLLLPRLLNCAPLLRSLENALDDWLRHTGAEEPVSAAM
jgi:hypothetical protein